MRVRSSVLILLLLTAVPTAAQVKYPTPPAKYHVDLRYRIAAEQNQRVRDYRDLTAALGKIGFVADPREDDDLDRFDPTAERLAGTIPAKDAAKLLDIPAVKTVLLRDAETPLPDDAKKPTHIRIRITPGLDLAEQRTFHGQVVAQLGRLGFVEFAGYDHFGYTVVRGVLPAGKVPDLLRDLRDQPSGWFFSEIPRDQLNLPLRDLLPIRLVEVLKDVDLGTAVPPPAPLPEAIASPKYSLDLRSYLADPATAAKPIRAELVMNAEQPEGARALRELLRLRVPSAAMEGVYGNFVVIRVPAAGELVKLAQIPSVVTIRLPRTAAEQPGVEKDAAAVQQALKDGNVTALHAKGYRGAGSRVVVLATDFPNLNEAAAKLPKGTQFLDLTAELSPTVEPTPAGKGGRGTETALAVHAAAPEAALTLVRLDPVAVHQLLTVAKTVLGDVSASVAVQTRGDELGAEADRLNIRRELVEEEYRRAFADLSDDEKPATRRKNAAEAFKKLQADEQKFKEKNDRLTILGQKLADLRGANVIVNTLVWEDGYAYDGLNEVSKLLDSRLAPLPTRSGLRARKQPQVPVWVQAGSTSAGSVWTGAFLDADGNGVMEFAPTAANPVPNTWTRELNFLTVLDADGKPTDTLPAGAKVRLSVQWREPRDPETELSGLASFPFTLKVLRQLDPTGGTAATDDLVVVAQTTGPATRIQRTFSAAVYEQTLEIAIPVAGRYALRIEGKLATNTLAATARTAFELRPRVYVTFTDAAKGRLALSTYAPREGGVAIPGDATTAVTVGVGGGLTGAGPGVLLRVKPDVQARALQSPAVATGVVAGTIACLVDAGVQPAGVLRLLTPTLGGALQVSMEWIQGLPAK
jgi:hypothetical protein